MEIIIKIIKRIIRSILELIPIFLFALIIALPIRSFLFQPFFVRGNSMEPTYKTNDYLLIEEVSYHFRNPRRGEIIVFKYPRNPSDYYIKRVIGLPGEIVEITNGRIKIYNIENPKGKILEEPYINNKFTPGQLKISLKKNEYFVLGDNREHSSDSRSWGALPADHIIGRSWLSIPILKIFLLLPIYQ